MTEKMEIIRKSFGLKEEIRPQLRASYHSSLIEQIKGQDYKLEAGRLTICLAREFGFCYGVDRAIDYAYETRAKFPGRRIFLTNEIIHNPRVNAKLQEMGIEFLSGPYARGISFEEIGKDDVVIIPAFGTPVPELEVLSRKGCVLVDTTCGSVMSVWKRVESYAKGGFTSVIHGKFDHEETRATSSRALQYPEGKYLIVRDKAEAQKVCDYIEGSPPLTRRRVKGNREEFLNRFAKEISLGFDPDRDLDFIGCANQTTMLSSESVEIANMLEASIAKKFGEESLQEHFRHFDTICSATQERQDAVLGLAKESLDLMVVVGGYNSSNTGHLVEISLEFCPAYHVEDAASIISKDLIRHKKVMSPPQPRKLPPATYEVAVVGKFLETRGWLPKGKVRIGITAGASTPNRVIEEVIERIIQVASNQLSSSQK